MPSRLPWIHTDFTVPPVGEAWGLSPFLSREMVRRDRNIIHPGPLNFFVYHYYHHYYYYLFFCSETLSHETLVVIIIKSECSDTPPRILCLTPVVLYRPV